MYYQILSTCTRRKYDSQRRELIIRASEWNWFRIVVAVWRSLVELRYWTQNPGVNTFNFFSDRFVALKFRFSDNTLICFTAKIPERCTCSEFPNWETCKARESSKRFARGLVSCFGVLRLFIKQRSVSVCCVSARCASINVCQYLFVINWSKAIAFKTSLQILYRRTDKFQTSFAKALDNSILKTFYVGGF